MSVYDVIIVGAGPAGSTLAYRLAKAGLDVLLLDQAQMPRVKPCGGGIDGLFMRNLPEGIDLGGVIEATATETIVRFEGQEQGRYPLPEPIYMTQRKFLDQRLALSAKEVGAHLIEGFKVRDATGYDEDGLCRVYSDTDTFASHILVGADGAYSTVARCTGLPVATDRRWRTTFVASEWDVEVLPLSQREYGDKAVIDCSVSPLGYGWVFPKGDHMNVGFGLPYKQARQLKSVTRYFLENRSGLISFPKQDYAHWIPFAKVGAPVVDGSVLLVGDAAGMADPTTGAGISWGVRSSRLAASTITHALKTEAWDVLEEHQANLYSLQKELQAGMALRNLLILNFAARKQLWEDPFKQVLECLSGHDNYLSWAGRHPWQYRLGMAVQKLLVEWLI